MKQGWIKLHRQLLESAVWVNSNLAQRTILITLFCMANHQENDWEWGGEPYTVKPGQFITSAQAIEKECNSKEITRQKIRSALNRFSKMGVISVKSNTKNILVTIINWGKYQLEADEGNQVVTKSQPRDNQEITKSQPNDNQQITTNKNVKKDNNDMTVKNVSNADNVENVNGNAGLAEKTDGVANMPNELDREKQREDIESICDKSGLEDTISDDTIDTNSIDIEGCEHKAEQRVDASDFVKRFKKAICYNTLSLINKADLSIADEIINFSCNFINTDNDIVKIDSRCCKKQDLINLLLQIDYTGMLKLIESYKQNPDSEQMRNNIINIAFMKAEDKAKPNKAKNPSSKVSDAYFKPKRNAFSNYPQPIYTHEEIMAAVERKKQREKFG